MLTLIYAEEGRTVASSNPADLTRLLAGDQTFWLDLETPSQEELELLREQFHFHPLALEDAAHPHQRPKLDEYGEYVFLAADEVTLDVSAYQSAPSAREAQAVQARQMAAFLGSHFLVTVHTQPVTTIQTLRARCDHHAQLLQRGPDYILYSLLDALVDGYFPLLEALEEQIDELEDRIVDRPDRSILDTLFGMKRDLTRLRRHTSPLREVLQSLTSRDFPNVHSETLPYFRDVADHLFRIYETLDSHRDLMSNMLDAYLSQVSNEMNRVMQKLSIVATIFLPITFITGYFGMNFDKQPWMKTDVWFWTWVMTMVAAGTYWWFRKRHWV